MDASTKILVKFFWDCGRMGFIESLFVTTEKELEDVYGEEIYFGEVLGKHSEVRGILTKDDITIISKDLNLINLLEASDLELDSICGLNPLLYIKEE